MVQAADHGDGPVVAGDQAADLADGYIFVDPGDTTKIVIITTVRGFIVPGEAGNFAIFDSNMRYRFQIENTGPVDDKGKPIASPIATDVNFDPAADAFIDVTFSKKTSGAAQTATVQFSGSAFDGIPKGKYVADARAATLDATAHGPGGAADPYFPVTPQKLKAAPKKAGDQPGAEIPVEFFAGEVDDPFFFDIPGFIRFRDRFIANLANPGMFPTRLAALTDAAAELERARDTFAGYNVMTIAFRLPIAELKSTKSNVTNATKFGLSVQTQRKIEKVVKGDKVGIGTYNTVDRVGTPGVNALIVPLASKAAFNGGTTIDDSKGKFAEAILSTLNALQVQGVVTDPTTPLGLLAKLAVFDGDFVRIDTSVAPASPGAHFPNGRRLEDDVVATLLSVIASSTLPPNVSADDGVTANDQTLSASFPYLGLPHQPRDPGVVDDNTRN